MTLELTQNVQKDENGYFELYSQILAAKAASMSQYPYIFLFLKKADEETHPEALSEISERREKYQHIMQALRDRADITVFSPEIDYVKLGNIMDYTVDGLLEKNIKGENFRAELFYDEAEEYIDMIRKMAIG